MRGTSQLKKRRRMPVVGLVMTSFPYFIAVDDDAIEQLERLTRERGASAIRLETNKSLDEAIGLYRSSGYREVPPFNDEPYADHWFEKKLA